MKKYSDISKRCCKIDAEKQKTELKSKKTKESPEIIKKSSKYIKVGMIIARY